MPADDGSKFSNGMGNHQYSAADDAKSGRMFARIPIRGADGVMVRRKAGKWPSRNGQ